MGVKGFVFVGEQPSHKAERMQVTWRCGHLAARTLFDALLAMGLDPTCQIYINLFGQKAEKLQGFAYYQQVISQIKRLKRWQRQGYEVVAMGRKVERVLKARKVEHRFIIHPAARGRIRKKEIYQQHVREALLGRR